jgi:hypothetical protein
LDVNHIQVTEPIKLLGSNSGFDERLDIVKHFTGKPASGTHFFDISGGLDGDGHRHFGSLVGLAILALDYHHAKFCSVW